MTAGALIPSARYAGRDRGRRVGWLELFFDLVFVAAISQVTGSLREAYTPEGVAQFGVLFVLVWLAWLGHSTFATRFDADTGPHRVLTVFQMFAVTIMAANASGDLAGREAAGFAAAYAVMRLVLVVQYLGARRLPAARDLATVHAAGHGAAALLWLASAGTPVPTRFALWAAAFLVDFATPWLAIRPAAVLPPGPHHLPERFGLFTLILLGESVIAIMHGVQAEEYWSVSAASAAVASLALTFALWWAYFAHIKAPAERHIEAPADVVRLYAWGYAHLPFYVALCLLVTGAERIVAHEASATSMALPSTLLAAALLLAGLWTVARTGPRRARPAESSSVVLAQA